MTDSFGDTLPETAHSPSESSEKKKVYSIPELIDHFPGYRKAYDEGAAQRVSARQNLSDARLAFLETHWNKILNDWIVAHCVEWSNQRDFDFLYLSPSSLAILFPRTETYFFFTELKDFHFRSNTCYFRLSLSHTICCLLVQLLAKYTDWPLEQILERIQHCCLETARKTDHCIPIPPYALLISFIVMCLLVFPMLDQYYLVFNVLHTVVFGFCAVFFSLFFIFFYDLILPWRRALLLSARPRRKLLSDDGFIHAEEAWRAIFDRQFSDHRKACALFRILPVLMSAAAVTLIILTLCGRIDVMDTLLCLTALLIAVYFYDRKVRARPHVSGTSGSAGSEGNPEKKPEP